MSAPVPRNSRGSGSSLQATRQQLEELEALLQRMLDLPGRTQDEVEPAAGMQEPLASRSIPPDVYRRNLDTQPTARTPESEPEPILPFRSYPTASIPQHEPGQGEYPGSPLPEKHPPRSYHGGEFPATSGMDVRPGPRIIREDRPSESPYGFGAPGPHQASHSPVDHGQDAEPRPGVTPHFENALPRESEWIPLRSSWKPSDQTWKPLVDTWEQNRPGNSASSGTGPLPGSASTAPEHPRTVTGNQYSGGRMDVGHIPTQSPDSTPHSGSDGNPGIGFGMRPVAPMSLGSDSQGPTDDFPREWASAQVPYSSTRGMPEVQPSHFVPPTPEVDTASQVRQAPLPVLFAPVIWFNRGFDLALLPLGPVGRWLAGPGGRTLLGVVGFLSLVAAATLALAERIGWTG